MAVIAVHMVALALLVLLGAHRAYLVLALRRRGRSASDGATADARVALEVWPSVTVQLPLYDEPLVAARAVRVLAALSYPRERLELQVLDDSQDATSRLVADAIAGLPEDAPRVTHLRRGHRHGYKAGALAHGLTQARGELVAIFDADFTPDPDFLLRVVPTLVADRRVGMVQARWGHSNEEASTLARVSALMLDGHFAVEHGGRAAAGCFFNFNGTAGVWRRAAIDESGGWQGDTLTEDLDLSYRAQLAGWRFVYRPDVVAPAELPLDMSAWKRQQRRWAKGAAETWRKLGHAVWRAPLSWRVRAEALLHLGQGFSHLAMAALALVYPWTLPLRDGPLRSVWSLAEVGALALGMGALALFYAHAWRGRSAGAFVSRFLGVMALGMGSSVSTSMGVLEALWGRRTAFERTPKLGDAPAGSNVARRSRLAVFELGLAVYFVAAIPFAIDARAFAAVPFLTLFAVGFAWVGWSSRLAASAPSAAALEPTVTPAAE